MYPHEPKPEIIIYRFKIVGALEIPFLLMRYVCKSDEPMYLHQRL